MRRAFAILVLAGIPAFAADQWLRLTTPEFEILTTGDEKQARETARHFEQVREFFLQASPLRNLGDKPLRVFQFETAEQYERFRPASHASAYFATGPDLDYIVIGDRVQGNFGPAIHEYMHLIIRHSGLRIPTWLNEGWSEVFSTLRPMGKETAVGDLIDSRMKTLTTKSWLDFNTLTSVDSKSPIYSENERTGIFYAESWALAHMFYLAPDYKDNFGKFLAALNSGKSTAEAVQIAWNKNSAQVFQDLNAYFYRKKLFGVVFATRIDPREDKNAVSTVPDFDTRLALADLLAAAGKSDEARQDYAKLEAEQPDRADLNQSAGFLALSERDFVKARQYLTKAFDAGSRDPVMCFDLAVLDREADVPPAKVIPILERAIAAKPDYTQAKVELGLMRIEARDAAGAIATLTGIPKISAQDAPRVYCGLAYAHTLTGELEKARQDLATCSKYAKAAPDAERASRIQKLIEARSDPAAAVRPGEVLQSVIGTALGVQCAAEGTRLQIAVADKVVAFDLPDPAAVEMPAAPAAAIKIQCGALPHVRIGVEFAPPRSVMQTSVGIVRRLDY